MNEDKGTRYRRMERTLRLLEVAAAAVALAGVALTPVGPSVRRASSAGLLDAGVAPGPGLDALVAAAVLIPCVAVPLLASLPFASRRLGALATRFGMPAVPPRALVRGRLRRGAAVVAAGSAAFASFARIAVVLPWLAGLLTALGVLAVAGVAMLVAPWAITWSPRVRPLRDEAVIGRLHALASRAQLRLAGLHEWVFGAGVEHANAALVGVLGPRRLLLSDTLLHGSPPEDVDMVVAHELGHHVHGHTWQRVQAQAVCLVLAAVAAHLAAAGPARWVVGTGGATDAASLPWMVGAAALAWVATLPWRLSLSRAHEAEADAFALALTGRPDVLERVLSRLGARNLASDDTSLLTRAFFLTHPPIPVRIAAARRAAEQVDRRPARVRSSPLA